MSTSLGQVIGLTHKRVPRVARVPLLCIGLTPLWWLLGTGFFIFHVAALLMILSAPNAMRPRTAFQWAVAALCAVLGLSLSIAILKESDELGRAVAALNNISILIVGYVFFSFFSFNLARNSELAFAISRTGGRLALIAVAIALAALFGVFMGRFSELTFPTLLGLITPAMDNLIGLYQRADVIAVDWFSESSVPRLTVLSANPTSSAAFIALSCFIGLGVTAGKGRIRVLVLLGLVLVTTAATLTRGAVFGLLAGMTVWFILVMGAKARFALIPLFPLVLIAAFSTLPSAVEKANSAREASSNTRMASYKLSYDMTMDDAPIIGMGIKPRVDSLVIPVGSHSTILSALVRGGIIGATLAFFAFFLMPAAWAAQVAWKLIVAPGRFGGRRLLAISVAAGLPSFLVFCLLQDVDAYAPLSVLLFTYLSVLSHFASRSGVATRSNEQQYSGTTQGDPAR